jgi:hypothetical protein
VGADLRDAMATRAADEFITLPGDGVEAGDAPSV